MTMKEEFERMFEEGEKAAAERGEARGMEKGMARGMEKGMARGMERGMERGEEIGKARTLVNNVLSIQTNLNLSLEVVLKTLNVGMEEYEKALEVVRELGDSLTM